MVALGRATQSLRAGTAVHICYGYGVEANNNSRATLGAIDVATETVEVEAPEEVAKVLRRPLEFVDADKLMPSSNCGMATRQHGTARLGNGAGRQSSRVRQAIRSRSDVEAPLGSAWQIPSGRNSPVAGLTVGQSEFVIPDCCGSSCRSHPRRTASYRRSCTPRIHSEVGRIHRASPPRTPRMGSSAATTPAPRRGRRTAWRTGALHDHARETFDIERLPASTAFKTT